jgi:hypothetical protein
MTDRFARRQAVSLLALIALCGWAVSRAIRPPAPVPATAPDTVFSAERAMAHVKMIAQRPHAVGMADHDRVRDYILAQLAALGVTPQLQNATGIGTRYQMAGRVQNIVAELPGAEANGQSILLMAHYDGVEAGPAASDDGAGSAALLETLRALQALRAHKAPLARGVVFLFTDGEEAGLLGAAAFVREHPWAHGVAFVVNFEARGTTGRSVMFETGPGNLDAVRVLRTAPDVTAGSLFTTVYRALPNDTDLSELALLGVPALNFAFADGVERYHTTHDSPAYLNPGSLQHHGSQMLAIAKTLGREPLPRPKTGDAVFFDMPVLGIVSYPVWMAVPLAIVALLLTVIVVAPMWRGAFAGAVAMLLSVAVVGLIARSINLTGAARWSGVYVAIVALCVAGVCVEVYRLVKRWKPDAYAGALVLWMLLAALTSLRAPATSYLFTWPLLFALIAARSRHPVARWAAAVITILIMAGVAYSAAAVMLGLAGVGSIALAVLVSLAVWLLMPTIEDAMPTMRAASVLVFFAPAAILLVIALLVVKPSAEHPVPTALTYVENADSGKAWLGSFIRPDGWTRAALGTLDPAPAWASQASLYSGPIVGHAVQDASLDAPTATLVSDSTAAGARRVVIRVNAPRGTTGMIMRAPGVRVTASSIDGRVVDAVHYRRPSSSWFMEYWAVPDSGALVGLTVPAGAAIDFEMAARRPGLPTISGATIPPRPDHVVPVQDGDASVVLRRTRF